MNLYVWETYQSPYKGFNRVGIDIRTANAKEYQSPYKGFNSRRDERALRAGRSVSIPL